MNRTEIELMIIMVNGAFGVGKTTISNELLKVVNNSMLYDSEEIGFMLRNILPNHIKRLEANTGDFQDLELWKELTVRSEERRVGKECRCWLTVYDASKKPNT